MDPRAPEADERRGRRAREQIVAKLKADPKAIDALVKEHSEDPGSQGGEPTEVNEKTGFVPSSSSSRCGDAQRDRHRQDRLRLPRDDPRDAAAPDPLESVEILNRPTAETGTVRVQHV